MRFTVAKRLFLSPILEWKVNGRLYMATEWAQHNKTGPKAFACLPKLTHY